MSYLRSLLSVALIAVVFGIGPSAARADDTKLVLTPDTVTKGAAQRVQIAWPTAPSATDTGLSTAKTVTVAGVAATLDGTATPSTMAVNVPALQFTGDGEVKVFADATKVIGVAVLHVVEPAKAESKTEWHPWVIAGYALLLVLFPFSLMWTDIIKAYAFSSRTRQELMKTFQGHSLTLDELKTLIAEFDTSPPGIPGLARATLALTLLLLIGLIIFYFVAVARTDISNGVEKLLTALTTALASVIAFYFGTKAAQGAPGGTTTTTPAPTGGAGNALTMNPASGAAGAAIAIHGSGGFGTTPGTVTFGSTPATTISAWADSLVTVNVPGGLTPGTTMAVTVTAANGTVFKSAPNAFTAQ